MKKLNLSDNIRKELEERRAQISLDNNGFVENLSFEERLNMIKENVKLASDKHISNENTISKSNIVEDKIVEEVHDEVQIELGNIVKQMLKEDEEKKVQEIKTQETQIPSEELKIDNQEKDLEDKKEEIEIPKVKMDKFLRMNNSLLKEIKRKSENGMKRLKDELLNETDNDKKAEMNVHIAKYEAIIEATDAVMNEREQKNKTQGEER